MNSGNLAVLPKTQDGSRWTDTLTALADPSLNPLFWRAERLGAVSAWWQHVPVAHWVVCATSPRVLVELGTHTGVSCSAFCNAVARAGLGTRCHAVDTWHGDPHAGLYGSEVLDDLRAFHDQRFGDFSTLLQCTFDEALGHIEDGSIDLLHIDGLHTYAAVRHDFESWLPKLSDRAVVLFHDINVRRDDFGVWRVWAELRRQYPAFDFVHGYGLGILAVGKDAPAPVAALCELTDPAAIAMTRARFARLGEHSCAAARERMLAQDIGRRAAEAERKLSELHKRAAEDQAQQARLRYELDERERAAAILQAEADARHAQVNVILRSTSWRITAPIRWTGIQLTRIRRIYAWCLRGADAAAASSSMKPPPFSRFLLGDRHTALRPSFPRAACSLSDVGRDCS
jgi:hypothetical protein